MDSVFSYYIYYSILLLPPILYRYYFTSTIFILGTIITSIIFQHNSPKFWIFEISLHRNFKNLNFTPIESPHTSKFLFLISDLLPEISVLAYANYTKLCSQICTKQRIYFRWIDKSFALCYNKSTTKYKDVSDATT